MTKRARKSGKGHRRPPKKGTRRGRGRPRKAISPRQVLALAKIGCSQEEMGQVLGVSPDTITRNYAEPYKRGIATLKQSLRRKQVNLALRGNVTMLIWLGKQWLDQSDKREVSGGIAFRDMEQVRKKRWQQAGKAIATGAALAGESDEP